MNLFFVLGRNVELSREEVKAYFEARAVSFRELFFSGNLLGLGFEVETNVNVNEFGGVLALGKLDFMGSKKDFLTFLEIQDIVLENKFSYYVYGEDEFLREKFKKERRKSTLRHGRQQLKFQEGEVIGIPHTDYVFMNVFEGGLAYFGKVSQTYDAKLVAYRDVEKPNRRSELAISPRLAKILVNLSGAKEGDLLLDPFAGVCGIVQEALLKEIQAYGSDKDREAVNAGKRNLVWLRRAFHFKARYEIERRDVMTIPFLQFDAVASETPLGELVKRKPGREESKRIIEEFTEFIVPVLVKLKEVKKPNARIAITFPALGEYRVDVLLVAKEANLQVLTGPIEEFRPEQYIGRDIVVFR